MKSRLKLTIIFLLVLLFFDSFSYSQKNTIIGYIDSFVNQIKFIDSNGSEIKIYAISGAKYDKIIFNRIVNGLKKYKSRKKYYTEILREISFQKDFKNIDALTTITNISDIQKIENSINIINQIIETADEFNLDKILLNLHGQ